MTESTVSHVSWWRESGSVNTPLANESTSVNTQDSLREQPGASPTLKVMSCEEGFTGTIRLQRSKTCDSESLLNSCHPPSPTSPAIQPGYLSDQVDHCIHKGKETGLSVACEREAWPVEWAEGSLYITATLRLLYTQTRNAAKASALSTFLFFLVLNFLHLATCMIMQWVKLLMSPKGGGKSIKKAKWQERFLESGNAINAQTQPQTIS